MTPTITPFLITSTLPVTLTSAPSETSAPSPPQPIIAPVDGVTSTQINVRAEPSTASSVLGIIPASTRVEITGKDPGENWWQINYPHAQAVDGKGWVTAQYITTAGEPQVPTIGGDEADPDNGNVAIVQQQLNVRSGPGTDFNSLGTLNPQDVVSLIGKDPNGGWLQVDFATGPEGKGWVNAAFVQAQGVENLPIITESGLVVGTGTPTTIPFTPTPTIVPAREDNDSPDNPLASVTFDPSGIRAFIYNGDVSAPNGDMEDWIQFTPFSEHIFLEISCTGSDLHIELTQSGQLLDQAACATLQIVSVEPDTSVQVHVSAFAESSQLYSSYTLKVTTIP
ncbi:MAG TPA: SH3 domain-containing protein [Anaerolineales bacterium]|nr:SH3 domain-containing protein [Anaerolineales bacterium]